MAQEFLYVFVKDGLSRVVPETIDNVLALEDDGWELVWDSARTEFDGHARAARLLRTVPEEWTDAHAPQAMTAPTVLYRSMSIRELEDVLLQGEIRGKGNRFNEFDERRFVFFGSRIDGQLTWHGEDVERLAINDVLENEWFSPTFDGLAARRRELFDRFEVAVATALERQARSYEAAGYARPSARPDPAGKWRVRGVPLLSELGLPHRGELAEIVGEMRANADEMRVCQDGFRKAVVERNRVLKAEIANLDHTSAVLEFAPMSHGQYYRDHDEYGFFPGSVFLSDVTSVHWVRNREVVETTGSEEIAARLDALRETAEGTRSPSP